MRILAAKTVQSALDHGTADECRKLADLADRAYIGSSAGFNPVTAAFVRTLNELSKQKLPYMENYQLIDIYSHCQRLLVGYKSEAAQFRALEETGKRVRNGQLEGDVLTEKLDWVKQQLSPQARKLL